MSLSAVQRGHPGCLTCPGPSRFFYQFLLGNECATAKEIRDEYVETLSKIYLSYYRSYVGRLMKVQVSQAGDEGRGGGEGGSPHLLLVESDGSALCYFL